VRQTINLFHVGWTGNYDIWVQNPIKTIPLAHSIFDPHFGSSEIENNVAYSGLYNLLYTIGFSCVSDIYAFLILSECLALASILLALVHLIYLDSYLLCSPNIAYATKTGLSDLSKLEIEFRLQLMVANTLFIWPIRLFTACFDLSGERLNYHIGALIGFFSIAWAGHIIHHALPFSRGLNVALAGVITSTSYLPYIKLLAFYEGSLSSLALDMDKDNHVFGSTYGAGESLLSFFGGLKPDTIALYLTDVAHHHLAIGILSVLAAHLYSSVYKGFGHRIRDVLYLNGNSSSMVSVCHKSLHMSLSLACGASSFVTVVVAQQIYSISPYNYMSYVTTISLYVHHQYIASLLMVAALVHSAIFLVRDYVVSASVIQSPNISNGVQQSDVLGQKVCVVLKTKGQLISHLSWSCLYLGFHSLGIYIHNDSVVAFGEPQKQILIEPVFAETVLVQQLALNFQPPVVYSTVMVGLGPGDLLVGHAIALGLHVSALVLLKGALDSRGSKLMPDKLNFALSFSCDGPTRGGTCDISAWDSAYLALFWVLNTDAWLMFYFHWKNLTIFENTIFQFDESSTYLNGWFRDYLWFNSASLLNGYNSFRANDLSCLSWIFLAAHLCWATGFMFLISWRGYWQELIDVIIVMHLKTPVLYDIWLASIYSPVALSIVQARLIGLTHFSVGFVFTYAAFVLGATS
jgi:photosystem I P700 chlorophyll a apoprotein A2